MSLQWTVVPAWMNKTMHAALVSDDGDGLVAWLAAGKVLHCLRAYELWDNAKDSVYRWMGEADRRASLLRLAEQWGDDAVEAAERAVGIVDEGAMLSGSTVATVALLRDDLEALHTCVVYGLLGGRREAIEDLYELDEMLASYKRVIDRMVEPIVHEMRNGWLAREDCELESTVELVALVSDFGNPWWVDVIDPLWQKLDSVVMGRVPLQVAMGTLSDFAETITWSFERGLSAVFSRQFGEYYSLDIRGHALKGVSAVEFVWVKGKKRKGVLLRKIWNKLWHGSVRCEVTESRVSYLVLDGTVVVRDRWTEPIE